MRESSIIIVEDEKSAADDLRQSLEEFGYSVIGVENSGDLAVKKIGELRPDLVLMDIFYRGKLGGIQAGTEIHRNFNIPVLFLAAISGDPYMQKLLDTCPYGYLQIPFRKKELADSVELALLRHSSTISGGISHITSNNTLYLADNLSTAATEFEIQEEPGAEIYALPQPEPDPFSNILGRHNTSLLVLCEDLKHDRISPKELNLLIKVSFKLGLARVKKNINKVFNLSQRWNLSPDDIAVEGISNLFIMNAKREMLNIRYSVLNWEEPLETSMDALFFLNKTVSLCIDQQINKMFREADPVFSKVLDAVNFAIRKYEYKKVDYNGTVCLVKCGSGPVAGTVISYDEFMNLPLDMSLSKQDMLAYLTSHLMENTDHFPAVPLNPFIERLLGSSQEQEDAFQLQTPSHFSRISMDDLIYSSLEKTICKLRSAYQDSGKLSCTDIDLISAALTDVAMDLREGNTIWQLSDYIKYYKKDLSKEEYKEKYQYIIEYLVKGFKQMIVRRLRNN